MTLRCFMYPFSPADHRAMSMHLPNAYTSALFDLSEIGPGQSFVTSGPQKKHSVPQCMRCSTGEQKSKSIIFQVPSLVLCNFNLFCLGGEVYGRWGEPCIKLIHALVRERPRLLHPCASRAQRCVLSIAAGVSCRSPCRKLWRDASWRGCRRSA